MNYSPELRDAMLGRMLPPNNESITKISREEGISEQTLALPYPLKHKSLMKSHFYGNIFRRSSAELSEEEKADIEKMFQPETVKQMRR